MTTNVISQIAGLAENYQSVLRSTTVVRRPRQPPVVDDRLSLESLILAQDERWRRA